MGMNAALLQGLLLVSLTYAQKNCRMEEQKVWFYIYNASVDMKAYFCIYNYQKDKYCTNAGKSKVVQKLPSNFKTDCETIWFWFWTRVHKKCELSVRAHLVENIITLPDNMPCIFSRESCYNPNISQDVFWKANFCQDLTLVHNNNFTVWSSENSPAKFIQDEHISLVLTEKITMCGIDIWKTNHGDVVVSQTFISTSKRGELEIIHSALQDVCGDVLEDERNDDSVHHITPWYLYSYTLNITVNMCLENMSSCQDVRLYRPISMNHSNLQLCETKFCKTPPCTYLICEKTLQIDLETDKVRELPPECNYSDGYCKSVNAFWTYSNECQAIKKENETFEESCGGTKCVLKKTNSTDLVLLRQGKLCGEDVWYTDQDGVVASQKLLYFQEENDSLEMLLSEQSEEIDNLRTSIYFVVGVVLLFIMWYLFSVVVNCLSLKEMRKTQAGKHKVSLLSGVSPALTVRRLTSSVVGDMVTAQEFQMHESVNNELYNTTLMK